VVLEAMEKVGRNALCPCGSGKKFKFCHGANRTLPAKENVAALLLDRENKRAVVVTKDILVNQILRDGPIIAKSFDRLTEKDIGAISSVLADAISIIFPHVVVDTEDYKPTCARLLASATTAFMASLEVARHGFRRPYGAMARNIIESLATVLHIVVEPTALSQFNAGTLQSTKSITAAKKVLPPFGRQYGMLSDLFVHINKSHASFEPIVSYEKADTALGFIVSSLRSNAWLIYAVAELVFHDEIPAPRYWRNVGPSAFVYDPSDTERNRLREFFHGEAGEP
jgi:hypothetical protein